jgi:eukaryotic-like serine/threonine-protein kinase
VTASNLAEGQIIGGTYTVKGILRHNGLTATYRAVAQTGREVALKVFDQAALSRPEIVSRLKESETSTNALPGTMALHVLDGGTDPGTGAPFMAVEYSAHPSLEYLLGLCPLAPADAVTVVRKVAQTLDAAHALGTAHLGLKPTNVFVGPAPACDTRVADFGVIVVRSTLRAGRDPAPVDFPWMAPEQAESGVAPDRSADVFSLALVAFFALTGRSYWRSCQGTQRDVTGWKREIAAGRASASARAKEMNVPLGAGADAVFARALAMPKNDRYQSAIEFAEALASVIGDPVAQVAPPAVDAPAKKPGATHKMTMMGIVAGAGPSGQRPVPRPVSVPVAPQAAPAAADAPVMSTPGPAAAEPSPQQPLPAPHPGAHPPGFTPKKTMMGMMAGAIPAQAAPPRAPDVPPEPMHVPPPVSVQAAPAPAAPAAPAHTPPPVDVHAAQAAPVQAAPPAAASQQGVHEEPIEPPPGVPARTVARVAIVAVLALLCFGAIAWGGISLVKSMSRPDAKPATSQAAPPVSAPAPLPAPVASAAEPVPAQSALAPAASAEAPPVATAAAPPVATAEAPPAEKPPVAQAPVAAPKAKSVAPSQPAPAPKPPAATTPAKPAKKCGKFLKKC